MIDRQAAIIRLRILADHIADMDSGSGDAALLRDAADHIERPRFDLIEPAILAFRDGDISIGRLRECFAAWSRGEAYGLPPAIPHTADSD